MSRERRNNILAWAGVAIALATAFMSYGALAQRVDRLERDRYLDSERLIRVERMMERACARLGCGER